MLLLLMAECGLFCVAWRLGVVVRAVVGTGRPWHVVPKGGEPAWSAGAKLQLSSDEACFARCMRHGKPPQSKTLRVHRLPLKLAKPFGVRRLILSRTHVKDASIRGAEFVTSQERAAICRCETSAAGNDNVDSPRIAVACDSLFRFQRFTPTRPCHEHQSLRRPNR